MLLLPSPSRQWAIITMSTSTIAASDRGHLRHIHLYGRENSGITIINSGDIVVSALSKHAGILAKSLGTSNNSPIVITNSGDLSVTTTDVAYGIYAYTSFSGAQSPITITNSGDIAAKSSSSNAWGIFAKTDSEGSPITINNSGDISATSTGGNAYGISISTGISTGALADLSSLSITNSGDISVTSSNQLAVGIQAISGGANSSINIQNTGDITASSGASGRAFGINLLTQQGNSSVTIKMAATSLRPAHTASALTAVRLATILPSASSIAGLLWRGGRAA